MNTKSLATRTEMWQNGKRATDTDEPGIDGFEDKLCEVRESEQAG